MYYKDNWSLYEGYMKFYLVVWLIGFLTFFYYYGIFRINEVLFCEIYIKLNFVIIDVVVVVDVVR